MAINIGSKEPSVSLAEALATYKAETGDALAPADPRRLHLYAVMLPVLQLRAAIDHGAKQSLIDYVDDENIEELGALLGEPRLGARASEYTQRFVPTAGFLGALTIPAGKRVTDGTNVWAVTETVVGAASAPYVDATVRCTVVGAASNNVAIGQIDTLFDTIPDVSTTSNITEETVAGRDVESLEAYRVRLREAPESSSASGPRTAYEANAKLASSSVADASCCGPDDAASMNGSAPAAGNVKVFIIEGERDGNGVLTSVIPDPSAGLITTVGTALSGDDNRPLCDTVTVAAPSFVDVTPSATYYVARSKANLLTEIQDAVEKAFDAYCFWQESKIGRDINPSELHARLVNAGAKRVSIASPAFTTVKRDQCARMVYPALTYGGLEDD